MRKKTVTKEWWSDDFETLIGRPISGESIKAFIRKIIKEKQNGRINVCPLCESRKEKETAN